MGVVFIIVMSICYLGAAVTFYLDSQIGLSIQCLMYALANVGTILIAQGY